MKKFIIILGLIFYQNCISQQRYVFDYYTVYEYKKSENDVVRQEITFSNSINFNFRLHATIAADSIINVSMRDNKIDKNYRFKNFSVKDIEKGKMFDNSTFQNYKLEFCNVNSSNFYEINFETINGIKTIHIIRYKNKKKRKIVGESFYETMPTEITKLQHYNMPVLSGPLWCQRFTLNENIGVITKAYFIENGVKIHFWTLKEIAKTNFTIHIK